MSDIFEIAYAATTNKLCIFTGTGFSKAITNNKAPSWQNLLAPLCNLVSDPTSLKSALFPADGSNPVSLEEAAQIISIELQKKDKNIHEEISKKIKSLKLEGDNSIISDFLSKQKSLEVLTTNYDKLFEELVGKQDCLSLSPGFPIPRSHARVNVYHVHGSVDSAANMIVTSNDYFGFINRESYFSRKLSTILHENTVVILGYSLGDTNLKAIISDYKGFSRDHTISSNLFLVSRSKINQHIKDYYAHCYGIRVIDNVEIHEFFKQLSKEMPNAEKYTTKKFEDGIKKILFEDKNFNREFVKVENSFYATISNIAAIGRSLNDPFVVTALGKIIQVKTELTHEDNAWPQYVHLAQWLIHLASTLEIKGTSIESIYLEATLRSMNTMRKEYYIGYSWHAYTSWKHGWDRIVASNRALIRKYIIDNTKWADALTIVNRDL